MENLDGTIFFQHAAIDNNTRAGTHGEDWVDTRQRVRIELHIEDLDRTKLGFVWTLELSVGQGPEILSCGFDARLV